MTKKYKAELLRHIKTEIRFVDPITNESALSWIDLEPGVRVFHTMKKRHEFIQTLNKEHGEGTVIVV